MLWPSTTHSHFRSKSLPAIPLGRPDPLRGLDESHIRRLELVDSYTGQDGSRVQQPYADLPQDGVTPCGNVVDDDRLDTQVGVNEESCTEDTVQERVEGARGKGHKGEGNKGSRQSALERPVVVAVGWRWWRNGRRVVNGALNYLCETQLVQHKT